MEKTFTLVDLQHYLEEARTVEKQVLARHRIHSGPSKLALQNLISYSRALEILKTNAAGTIFHLAN